jgi:arylsulfatase A-like enzyme
MQLNNTFKTLCLTLLLVAVTAVSSVNAKPNIILIIADDLGLGDVSVYGSEMIRTPHFDRLAREGMLAMDANAIASVCTPSRYGILAGRSYHRYPYNWNGENLFEEGRPTLASVLQENGYATAYFGKVHTGWGERSAERQHRQDIDWNSELPRGILEIGFDTYFGTPFSHNEPPFVFVEDRHVVDLDPSDPLVVVPPTVDRGTWGWGMSHGAERAHKARPVDQIDLIVTERAVDFIKENAGKQPFFINLALVAPHVPITPAPEFKGRTQLGWYGDFVEQFDHCIGRILETLEATGIEGETLVVVTSDNGAIYKRREYDLGHRANLDLLGQKTDAWQGGLQVPFVIRWPGHVPAGTRTDELISLMDLPKTFWAAAGIEAPEGAAEDSLNLLPLLTGATDQSPRTELYLIGITGQALRSGDWIYIPTQGSQGVTTNPAMNWAMQMSEMDVRHSDYDAEGNLKPDAPQAQLYNLRIDRQQTTNVILEHPEVASRLGKRFREVRHSR